jgi:putative hydrolases of HD superfamily
VGKAYVRTSDNVTVTQDQTAAFPPELAAVLVGLVTEYEARDSIEAQVARDADKLECLLQAREYEVAGYRDVPPWVTTSQAALQTASGRRLGKLCQQVPPSEWWSAAAAAYPQTGRPRALSG